MRLLISAGLNELASNVDLWETEDREEIAESIEEVRGMARCIGRSPDMECIELTEDDADLSGSDARDLDVISPDGLLLVDSVSTISGDCDKL